jgi:hypothetical protein
MKKQTKPAADIRSAVSELRIAEAMRQARGGHQDTPDAVLVRMYRRLPEPVQAEYLEKLKP